MTVQTNIVGIMTHKTSKLLIFVQIVLSEAFCSHVRVIKETMFLMNLQDFGSVILKSGRLSRGNVLESELG